MKLRILSLTAALLMAASALTACGETTPAEDDTSSDRKSVV